MREKVAVVMGSASDLERIRPALDTLDHFAIQTRVEVLSAHRSPHAARRFAQAAHRQGLQVIIACAGGAAHLAGVIASLTPLPVIGLPVETPVFKGLDSYLSTVEMPSGVPVATVAVGKAGPVNAALLAVEILALHDGSIRKRLIRYKRKLETEVLAKNREVKRARASRP
ncbi:MAG: 5-(carboxyamino)imidazole ribonucleotide mutase [Candidatus Omnitrophica bacterium]|nr:5-(carboxyamino)imidazole ribonucleotide mutase [Candidatus Omnitrophota bacterium]